MYEAFVNKSTDLRSIIKAIFKDLKLKKNCIRLQVDGGEIHRSALVVRLNRSASRRAANQNMELRL